MDKKELMKLCSFIVMGDGGLYKSNINYKFVMNMLKKHSDYINFCKEILENITSVRIYDRKDYNKDGCNRGEQLRIESNTHPFLTSIHDRIYVNKYKGLDPHAFKLFDWQCLAILFMCDGCSTYKKEYRDVTLNIKRLSYGDQLYLKNQIKKVMNIDFNINRQNQYYYLRLRSKDIDTFYKNIEPYIFPSFKYKILYAKRLENV